MNKFFFVFLSTLWICNPAISSEIYILDKIENNQLKLKDKQIKNILFNNKDIVRTTINESRDRAPYHCTSTKSFYVTGNLDLGTHGGTIEYIQDEIYSSPDAGNAYTVTCTIPTNVSSRYLYTRTSLNYSADRFINLTPSVSAQVKYWINDRWTPYIPFDKFYFGTLNHNGPATFNTTMSGGGNLSMVFKLIKPLSTVENFSGELFRSTVVLNANQTFNQSNVTSRTNLNLNISSSQECSFVAGDTFSLDLGDVANSSLNYDGIPNNYVPKTLDLSIKCEGFPPDIINNLSVSFDGNRASNSSKFVVTSKSGLGVGILDEDGSVQLLGTENAKEIPFKQNEGIATYVPSFYPAKLTEDSIEPGAYTSAMVATITLP
ncbi:TPA: fimbrial protein [Photobacterium damselae]